MNVAESMEYGQLLMVVEHWWLYPKRATYLLCARAHIILLRGELKWRKYAVVSKVQLVRFESTLALESLDLCLSDLSDNPLTDD